MNQHGFIDSDLLASHLPGASLNQGDIVFTVEEVPADVVVVVNYLKYDTRIASRRGYIWAWHNEPIVRQPFAKGLNRVYTHETTSDDRVVQAPPVLDWWVGKSWDELHTLEVPPKNSTISAIASTKRDIAGHRRRNDFIELVAEKIDGLDVFGAGRQNQLRDKWDGLAPYRYSVAIENSSKTNYWSEKISDCFMAFTVPLYFGAPNIADYFPEDSYIWLPLDDPQAAIEKINEVLSDDDWEHRLPAIHEARRLVLDRYSLFGQLTSRVRQEAEKILTTPRVETKVHGRRVRPGGWIRNAGLLANVTAQKRRLVARL